MNRRSSSLRPCLLLSALLCTSLLACQGEDPPSGADLGQPATPTQKALSVSFAAKFGSAALDCATSYEKVGAGKEHVHPGDVRMYVHNLRLVTQSGVELPVSLTKDGVWHSESVALLDFTTNTDDCTSDKATNTTVKGTYLDSGAAISGLRFTLGVPFAENHKDVASAAAPMNQSTMFWSWNSGYKFLLIEGMNHINKAHLFHLGSTGCMKDANNQVTGCSAANRVEVNLSGDVRQSGKAVVLDLTQLFGTTNLDNEVACHSSSAQPDCAPLFARLGLSLMGEATTPTQVFRIE